jgi:hypothetical protein
MEPAKAIVGMLGGPVFVAGLLELTPSAVVKWYRGVDDGGCGGLIPSRHIAALCKHARSVNTFLEPNMFFVGHI